MKRTRIALLVVGTTIAVLGLSACEKPNPGASVFSGTTTEFRRATCWAGDGTDLDTQACAQDLIDKAESGATAAVIPVVPGQVVGISVDPVVADTGWFPRINGQNLTPTPITSTYFRFTFPEFQEVPADGVLMELVAGDAETTRGVWLFTLATP